MICKVPKIMAFRPIRAVVGALVWVPRRPKVCKAMSWSAWQRLWAILFSILLEPLADPKESSEVYGIYSIYVSVKEGTMS